MSIIHDTVSHDASQRLAFEPRTQRGDGLSGTELHVLVGIARGFSSKEIAGTLNRSPATVEGCIRLLLARFNARTRCHLIARVIREGVIDPRVSD